jgi:hypothetical protein
MWWRSGRVPVGTKSLVSDGHYGDGDFLFIYAFNLYRDVAAGLVLVAAAQRQRRERALPCYSLCKVLNGLRLRLPPLLLLLCRTQTLSTINQKASLMHIELKVKV